MVLGPPGPSAASGIPLLRIPLVADGRLDIALVGAERFALLDVGGSPEAGPRTRVAFAASPRALAVLFDAEAEPPLEVTSPDGGPVYKDECVEIFVADPGDPAAYREIVVNPAGARYGAEVRNPDGNRATWSLVPGRLPGGIAVDVTGEPAGLSPAGWTRWRCRIELPWSSLSVSGLAPLPGEERRLNAYRIARGRTTRFQAVSPTLRASPPDFHVPSRFARVLFEEPSSSFEPAC
jgi:hypothetical protein